GSMTHPLPRGGTDSIATESRDEGRHQHWDSGSELYRSATAATGLFIGRVWLRPCYAERTENSTEISCLGRAPIGR
ncbi:MAG: hypothetical protein ACRD6N_15610, partial [Pyrinomonadaceae bacterium]